MLIHPAASTGGPFTMIFQRSNQVILANAPSFVFAIAGEFIKISGYKKAGFNSNRFFQ